MDARRDDPMMLEVDDATAPFRDATITHDFDRLFSEEGPGLWRTIYAFTGGRREIAEEAVAESFARAIAHATRIRDPLAWIYRTAFRLAREELQRERRPAPEIEPGSDEPSRLLELIRALRELSPHQRAAIVLRYEADLSIAEVADRMGIAAPTVRVHLFRGRRRLRELLGTEEVTDA
jgi:RNA polymerase sigma-70 factor, ECF subfamily